MRINQTQKYKSYKKNIRRILTKKRKIDSTVSDGKVTPQIQ